MMACQHMPGSIFFKHRGTKGTEKKKKGGHCHVAHVDGTVRNGWQDWRAIKTQFPGESLPPGGEGQDEVEELAPGGSGYANMVPCASDSSHYNPHLILTFSPRPGRRRNPLAWSGIIFFILETSDPKRHKKNTQGSVGTAKKIFSVSSVSLWFHSFFNLKNA